MRLMLAFSLLTMLASGAVAEPLFDIPSLCKWQNENNGMDLAECTRLEEEAKTAMPALEASADANRQADCRKEAEDFAADSGFASYALYSECLKNGPQSY